MRSPLAGLRSRTGQVEQAPRVLLVGDQWIDARPGGLNRYLVGLFNALQGEGVDARALVIGPSPALPGVIGVSNGRAPVAGRLVAMARVCRSIAAETDVVDAHFALYALPVLLTPLRRRSLVVHFQGPWAEEGRVGRGDHRLLTGLKRMVESAVYRRADVVVTLSDAFAELVVERSKVARDRVVVIPPAVNLEQFRPGDRSVSRTRLQLDPAGFVAVAVRRLDRRMGLDVLIEGWAKVRANLPDSVLLIAGDGAERGSLAGQIAGLAEPDGVRLLGTVSDEDLAHLYRAANCSVVPSRALEGFGLVTLESLACGTPPVVTDIGGLADAVRGLDASLIVPPADPEALAERLLALASGSAPDAQACRRHAAAFAWPEVARRHLALYERLARRRLRVAYVDHTAVLSGGELALSRLVARLDGVDPVVILGEDGPLAERLRGDGILVEIMPLAPSTCSLRRDRVTAMRLPLRNIVVTLAHSWRLSRHLRRLRPDLVHTNSLKADLYGGLAGRLAGVPVVWHVRDRLAPDYLPRAAVWLMRSASRFLPTAVIANSAATLDTVAPGGRGRQHRFVLPSPVAANGSPAQDRRSGGPFTVGMVGRLAPWKGQDVFLRAFARAFSDGDERARVIGAALFGEQVWKSELRALADQLHIADRVDFVGFVDDVVVEYASLDVVVHASVIPEPFGQVVVEAMAAGIAVIATDAGGPAEIITDGVDGLLVPTGDCAALSAALLRLAADADLRRRLGAAGVRRAADYSPDRIASRLELIYRTIGTRRLRPEGHRGRVGSPCRQPCQGVIGSHGSTA
jgi:glycosyltransferase involved in cell wall biosynthesis